MRTLHLWAALLGTLVLVLGFGADVLRSRGYLPSELMLATAVGVALGPVGLDLFDVASLAPPTELLREVARVTVAIAVMSIGLQLPERYVRERAVPLAVLIGPGMVVMWLASSALVYGLVVTSVPTALLVGAIVSPTDPVIATSIVQGRTATENVPERLRYLLMGEAGANDGVAYLLVFLGLFLVGATDHGSLADWAVAVVGVEVLGGLALGAVVGTAAGNLENVLSDRDLLDETSTFTVTVALTFAVLGVASVLGLDDILAVFVAGLAYNWHADPGDERREQSIEEVFNRLFTLPIFALFGAAIPWTAWTALGWRGVALVVGVLLLRRLPMAFAFRRWIGPLDRPAATLFVGWFGPIGVAALFYATLAVHETGAETPWVLASLVVAGSIVAHGATATAATHWYGALADEDGSA